MKTNISVKCFGKNYLEDNHPMEILENNYYTYSYLKKTVNIMSFNKRDTYNQLLKWYLKACNLLKV